MGRNANPKPPRGLQVASIFRAFWGSRWPRGELLLDTRLITSAVDPVRETVAAGIAAGKAKHRPTGDIRIRSRAIRDRARAEDCRQAAISELLLFVGDYPTIEEFQKIVARLLHEVHDEEGALAAWLGICLRFPESMDAFLNLVVLTHRYKGTAVARTLLSARFPRMPRRLDHLLAYAEACDLAGATAMRRAAFERLARMFAKRNDSWLIATSWLEEEYGINRSAAAVLRRLAAGTGLGIPRIRWRRRRTTNSDLDNNDHGVANG